MESHFKMKTKNVIQQLSKEIQPWMHFSFLFTLAHIMSSGFVSLYIGITRYLRIATVRASGELAQGQMTSCLRPLLWKTLRNASQEEIDPEGRKKKIIVWFLKWCYSNCKLIIQYIRLFWMKKLKRTH